MVKRSKGEKGGESNRLFSAFFGHREITYAISEMMHVCGMAHNQRKGTQHAYGQRYPFRFVASILARDLVQNRSITHQRALRTPGPEVPLPRRVPCERAAPRINFRVGTPSQWREPHGQVRDICAVRTPGRYNSRRQMRPCYFYVATCTASACRGCMQAACVCESARARYLMQTPRVSCAHTHFLVKD